jgi:CHAT domain-containing protein/Flp pilus assembly protein TadD
MKNIFYLIVVFFPILSFAQDWNSHCDKCIKEFNQGNFQESIKSGDDCLSIMDDTFGDEDTSYCNILYYLSYAHYYLEDYQNAADAAYKEVQIRKKIQGEEDPNYITACYNHSVFSTYIKDYKTAIIQMRNVKNFYDKTYGKESIYAIAVANQYSNILNLAGSYNLAKESYEETYAIIKKNYTMADSIFQAMTNTISTFYYTHGLFDLCEPFFTNALDYQAKAVGKLSETYLLTLNNTAEFYLNAGMYEKAEKAFLEQVDLSGKFYGKKSADYATSMNNLAVVYENQDRLEEAEELYIKTIKLKAKVFKKESSFYALTILNYGILKYRMNQYEESEELLLEALNIYENIASKDNTEYLRTLTQIAAIWQSNGEFDKSIKVLQESLLKIQSSYGKENVNYISVLELLASNYIESGELEKGRLAYEEVLDLRDKIQGTNHPDYASTMVRIARVKSSEGDIEAAENLLQKALEIRLKIFGSEHMDVVASYSELASIKLEKGNAKEAEVMHENALKLVREIYGEMHPDYLIYLSNAGVFYLETGQLDKAQNYFNDALQKSVLAHGENTYETHYIYNNLGNLYVKKGDFKSAEESFQKTIDILKSTVGEQHPDYASVLNSLGVLYYQLDNYKKSEKYYAEAIELYKRLYGKEHPQYATICNNVGSLYMKMGIQPGKVDDNKLYLATSEKFFAKVMQIDSATTGVNHIDFAMHLSNLAELYRYQNNWQKAEEYYLLAIALEEKILGKFNLNSVISYNNLALMYLGLEDFEKAEIYATSSMQAVKQNYPENALMIPGAWNTLAYIYEEQGKFKEALALHEKTLKKSFKIVQENFSFLSEDEKTEYLKDFQFNRNKFFGFVLRKEVDAPKVAELAYEISLFEKGLLLKSTQKMKEQILASQDDEVIAKYEHWIGLKQELSQLYSRPLSSDDQIKELESTCDNLEKQLVSSTSKFQKDISISKDYADVDQKLLDGDVAIEFIEYEGNFFVGIQPKLYSAVILVKGEEPMYLELFEAEKLEEIIGKVGGNNLQYVNQLYGTNKELNNQLYKVIWARIDSLIKDQKRVYFAPSGLLNKISFAALRSDDGIYISDKYQLHQLNSTAKIPSVRNKDLRKSWEITLFGGAEYSLGNTENEIWKYLEGTLRETHNIGHLLNASNFKVKEQLGPNATEENLKAYTGEAAPSILHIATHGFFYPDPLKIEETTEKEVVDLSFRGGSRGHQAFVKNSNPLMRSGLVLTGANNVWNKKKDTLLLDEEMKDLEDGVITAFEISSMDLSKTELAVLSACETGLGDIKGSEGVYGLQRAFKIAGVNSIIMSLWQVPDKETEEFMTLFYKNLVKEKNIRKSFQLAQSVMRKKYDPYFWAAFVLVE